ncbi:type II toxin-antitoxin system RelE/ParE family toxin [Agrobacterium rosae]|uniref:type II toxin-antitoxin system RelE/ParE family toxin n=1 Tax=Agrobacterium rosae TaxID=1972867 RepID=UPI0009FB5EA3|nr:type II toxin-antitoxin system RelE/ParE family toxin [Agrobacterium rosae]
MFLWIATDDTMTASTFIRDLTRKIEWIAASGFPGLPRDELSQGLKALPYRQRCIYFRIEADTVRILRVMHGCRHLSPKDFKQEEN